MGLTPVAKSCQSLSPRQLVNQLVEVTDFAHERVFDLFHSDAADQALDECPRGVEFRRLGKEGLEIGSAFKLVV